MSNKNYEYFKNNLRNLFEQYGEKFLVIKNCAIIGVYDSFSGAIEKTLEKEEIGTFIVQRGVKDIAQNSIIHNSNVLSYFDADGILPRAPKKIPPPPLRR